MTDGLRDRNLQVWLLVGARDDGPGLGLRVFLLAVSGGEEGADGLGEGGRVVQV